jgi:hypothetical protein
MKRSKAAVLGLTALALLATSAFVASSAPGKPVLKSDPDYSKKHSPKITHDFECLKEDDETLEPECTGHGEEAPLHREHSEPNIHTFQIPLGKVTCEVVTFEVTNEADDGKADGTSETAPTTPEYDECDAVGNPAVVEHNECEYEFNIEDTEVTSEPEEGYEANEGEGSATVKCPKGNAITITFPGPIFGECHAEVTPQATITPLYFRNSDESTDPTDITVEAYTAEVLTHFEGGLFVCGTGNGTKTALYTGNTTVEGLEDETHEQVNVRFDEKE